jgi:Domain of unknown function (DUF4329)
MATEELHKIQKVFRLRRHFFNSIDEAGIEALKRIIEVSIVTNSEFSGGIVQLLSGRFSFTEPETLGLDDSSGSTPNIPSGAKLVALYHTHGGANHANGEEKTGSEQFSFADMAICRSKNLYGYLGTPRRRVLKLTPSVFIDSSDKRKENYFGYSTLLTTIESD